jgi:hypothetical protein
MASNVITMLWIRYCSFVHNTAVLRGGAILMRWSRVVIDVIPAFEWPANGGASKNATWYAAMTDPDITMILGEMDIFGFGWK